MITHLQVGVDELSIMQPEFFFNRIWFNIIIYLILYILKIVISGFLIFCF